MSINRNRLNEPTEPEDHTGDPDAAEPPEPVVINDVANADTARDDATTAGVIRSEDTGAMPTPTPEEWTVDVGVDVVGACGHKIGEVVDVRGDCVVVEKGFFVPEDIFVPKSAIAGADEHHIILNVTRDDIEHSDWDEDPDAIEDELPERKVS